MSEKKMLRLKIYTWSVSGKMEFTIDPKGLGVMDQEIIKNLKFLIRR